MPSSPYSILVPAAVVIIGWIVAHWFNLRRDALQKRRDLRVQYMLDAYRRLEAAANRKNSAAEGKAAFESAVADIQLLGTPEQIATMLGYLRKHAAEGGSNIDPVLELLRKDVRRELGLDTDVEEIKVFRFKDDT